MTLRYIDHLLRWFEDKFRLPVIATTFPSNLLRLSVPLEGPRNHIRKKCVKKVKITMPAIADPTAIPTIAPVPGILVSTNLVYQKTVKQ
jgi:hypothetical protein